MYENGQVVDLMRVVAGRPDPIAQTPMMNAYIRYVALNPYWNSPPDLTSKLLAPRVIKVRRAYFTKQGYEVLSTTSDRRARAQSDVPGLARRRCGPADPDAPEAGTCELHGTNEVHVSKPTGNLAARHA